MSSRRPSAKQRERVRANAGNCCEYCRSQEQFSPDTFSVEHIVPQGSGGSSALKNLALACQGCNNHKYLATEGVDPITGEMATLYHPRRERWGSHFAWSDDLTLIVGLTPTGRATVVRLALNRPAIVNLRRVPGFIELASARTGAVVAACTAAEMTTKTAVNPNTASSTPDRFTEFRHVATR